MTQVKSMSFATQQPDLLRIHATASRFDPHLHSTYSIVALKRGAAEIRSARWSETARAGDIFFFNPYEVHSASCSEDDAEYDTFYPSEEFLIRSLAIERCDGPLNIQTTILKRNSETKEFIEALRAPALDGNSLEASLRRVLAACDFTTDYAHESSGALAARACMLIRKNCTRAMRTEDLAREMGVHKSHLVRAFSKAVGMAPQTYMRQVRVAKARELIFEGSPISEVALLLDFSDQAHLTREFKKVYGVPPGALLQALGIHR
jgi:AraC-like DNA-binding protein